MDRVEGSALNAHDDRIAALGPRTAASIWRLQALCWLSALGLREAETPTYLWYCGFCEHVEL